MIEIIQALIKCVGSIINAFAEHPQAAGLLLLAYLGEKYR